MNYFKIFSILMVSLCLSYNLSAQTEKGNVFLGGDTKLNFVSFNSKWETDNDNGEAGKSKEFEFSPQIGFFTADNIALGIEVPILFESQIYEDDSEYSSTSFAFAPFLKYYFGTASTKPFLFGEFGVGNAKANYDAGYGTPDEMTASMFLYEIGGGVSVFLNEKVAMDFELGYASVSVKPKEDNDNNYKSINGGFGLGIGFIVVL